MVAVIDVLPVDVQVAPVMEPPPLLDVELLLELVLELLVEVELLELDDAVPPYEQYRGLATLVEGNREAEQVIGPVRFAYTNEPDFP
jgi:hypothetical protein